MSEPPETNEVLRARFFSLVTKADVASLLNVSARRLNQVVYVDRTVSYCHTWVIPKRSGGTRDITAPRSTLYFMQARLAEVLQAVYEPRHAVHGFVRGRSIVTNAQIHVRRRFVLNIDLKDFFPSIHFGRVRGMFLAAPFRCTNEVATVLAGICCVDNTLPIGGPTSPVVANMVCLRLDSEIQRLARSTGSLYTRYADDITLSTNRTSFPVALARQDDGKWILGTALQRVLDANGFEVNPKKIRLQNWMARQTVTGVVVNKKLNTRRAFVREIRAMLHAWEKYGLEKAGQTYKAEYSGSRYPGASPRFDKVVEGKISYLAMVKGADDPVVASLRLQHRNLFEGRSRIEGIQEMRNSKNSSPIVRILHLSDLHFRESTSWDSSGLLSQLARTVEGIEHLDLVIVTGDIAFSASSEEYGKAQEWLTTRLIPSAGVAPSAIFFCPGNHDVQRSKATFMVKSVIDSIIKSTDVSTSLAEVLASGDRELFLERFANYRAFVTAVRGSPTLSDPYWHHEMAVNGVKLSLAATCSPLNSYDEKDRGRLMLGLPVLASILTETPADLRISLTHHPFDYLHPADNISQSRLSSWSDVILRGHLHTEDYVTSASATSSVVTVAAGAAYEYSASTHNGFHVLEYSVETSELAIFPYRWDPADGLWYFARDIARTTDGVIRKSIPKSQSM
jgi:RNA-directed DNA polymerase